MFRLGFLLFLACSSIFQGILARSPHANQLAISLSRMKRFKELPDISGNNMYPKEQLDQDQSAELLILPKEVPILQYLNELVRWEQLKEQKRSNKPLNRDTRDWMTRMG